jgi:TMEM175 potassium channel family protein
MKGLWDSAIDGRDRIHLLQQAIIRTQSEGSILKDAIRRDWKGKLSPILYLFAVVATLRSSWISQAALVIAALIWLIPDQRIEKRLAVSGRLAIGPQ